MTTNDILVKIAAKEISVEDGQRMIEQLNTKPVGKLSMKVSEKGGLSVYGLQRMPVTLYAQQWERLLGHVDDIKAFIKANSAKLATK